MYTVSEDEGLVEVCAVVFFPSGSCPIQFRFDIRLGTSDGTTGKGFGESTTLILLFDTLATPLAMYACHQNSVHVCTSL